MIFRFVLAGLCVVACFAAVAIILVMPSPMVLADPIARLVYIAVTAFLVIVAAGAIMVMLTILDRRP